MLNKLIKIAKSFEYVERHGEVEYRGEKIPVFVIGEGKHLFRCYMNLNQIWVRFPDKAQFEDACRKEEIHVECIDHWWLED